jgi:hypothetical protein
MTGQDVLLEGLDPRTRKRFKRAKQRSRNRMGATETTHDEFMLMLLDVWELHERDHELPELATVGQRVRADGGDRLTEADAWDAAVEVLIELAADDSDYQRVNEGGKVILSDARRKMTLDERNSETETEDNHE